MLIVPPGSCIVHQVNLEYLARVVFIDRDKKIENKIQESEMIKFSKVTIRIKLMVGIVYNWVFLMCL